MEHKKTKLKVVVRVRPALLQNAKVCVEPIENSVEITNHRNVHENIKYDFSAVYDTGTSQERMYNENVKPIVKNALHGQNLSIFAYGPTGAGKTHTMLGSPTDPGIIPRVINGLFQEIKDEQAVCGEDSSWKYKVTFSFLEIYNEKVYDLVEQKNVDLPIREDSEKNIFVAGLAQKEIKDFSEFKQLFGSASNNRTVAATKLNDRSSRSHCIVLLRIKKSQVSSPYHTLHGKIYLIDLAGSEDNRRTGNQGIRLKESGAINRSLFALGEVVDAINNGLPRIPYRNSKLTRLLQDSIGGSCHSVMVTNIAPEEQFYYDTYCTLNFASKSKKIVNVTTVKETNGQRSSSSNLKRPLSDSFDENNSKKKFRKEMSPNTSSEAPVVPDPIPLFSSIMDRQSNFEESINNRLEELEKTIADQIRLMTTKAAQSSGSNCAELQQQLKSMGDNLKEIKHLKDLKTPKPKKEALQDKTNLPSSQELPSKAKRKLQDDSISSTPLFVAPSRIKRKGFKSTACSQCDVTPAKKRKKSNENSFILETKKQKKSKNTPLNTPLKCSEYQSKHNDEFLNRLNTASIKELQQLHTVGNKRARLIHEWREKHGQFSEFDDLKKIPGFTEKFIGNLLTSNFVQVDD